VEREAVPWQDWAITTIVDTSAHWQQVWKAVECHQSQMASYAGLADLSPETHQFLWGHQHFYRALSLVNGGRKRESDLFEGLR
jgi:LmbE family N-acetylglucosaminyl deacetylase